MRRPAERALVRRRLCLLGLGIMLGWLWLLASGPAAGAHALLRDSEPADGASLDRAPRQVLLTFTERPEPELSTVHVLDEAGREVEAAKAAPVAGQPLQLAVPLGDLPDGSYTVSWRVLSRDDGHVTAGSFAFGVGEAAGPAATATQAAPGGEGEAPTPLAVAGRWALYGGLVLLLGAAATGLAVFGRTLPSASRPLLAVGAGLAVAGLAARFVAEYLAVDAPFGDLLASSTGTGLLRLAVGVAVAVVAATLLADGAAPASRQATATRPEDPGKPAARPGSSVGAEDAGGPARVEAWRLWLLGAATAAAMLLHVLAGHAAGPSSLRPLNLEAQWVHVLAVGAWIGGLVWLLAGLRGRQRGDQVAAVVRFSKLAAPVLAVVVLTGLARAADLAGGWRGLLDSGWGRVLDVKVLLFLGLVALAALNRYRVVPALSGEPRRLETLQRNVRGEVALAACVLAAAALLSQLPPGKFVTGRVAARPAPPQNLQVEGNDFATSVRLDLTVSPGTAGPNAFTAKVTDYDTGAVWPADRVSLRFTPRDKPEVGGATLELARDGDGLWQGKGSMLSIDGAWVVVALVQAPGSSVTVPLELQTRSETQRAQVSKVPGQPTLYTIELPTGGTLQSYVDPGRPGANTVHFTFFTAAGGEQTMDQVHATMTTAGASRALELLSLGTGHVAANIDLQPGQVSFAVEGSTDRDVPVSGRFEQVIE